MKKLTLVHTACLLVCGASLSTAHAQSASPAAADTPEIIVTASRSEQVLKDALPASTLITRADIERSYTSDLPTLLRQVTGLDITQSGGRGALADMRLRGGSAKDVLVLVDGVPINSLNGGTGAIEHIPVSLIEKIEFVRGNVSPLYGSAARSGVIQIFTRSNAKTETLAAGIKVGSRGNKEVFGALTKTLINGFRVNAHIEDVSEKGFNSLNQTVFTDTNPDLDGYKRRAYSLGVQKDFAMGSIGLTTRNAFGKTNYDDESESSSSDISSLKFESKATTLVGQVILAPSLKLNANISQTQEKSLYDAGPYLDTVANTKSQNQMLGLEWAPGKGQTLNLGIEGIKQRLVSNTAYDKKERKISTIRASYLIKREQFQLQLGSRSDKYSDFGQVTTGYLGGSYFLNNEWRLIGSKSTGFNAPNFGDLYYPGAGNSNPNLKAERLSANEVGMQFVTNEHDIRLIHFVNDYKDKIVSLTNVGQAKSDGFEFSQQSRYNKVIFSTGYTLQTSVNSITGVLLDRQPRRLARVGASVDLAAVNLGFNYKYVGAKNDTFYPAPLYTATPKTLDAYSLLDLTASYQVNKHIKLQMRLDNALNKAYVTTYGYNQAGRGIFAGLNWQMK
jgi:vitamin B12 transporter